MVFHWRLLPTTSDGRDASTILDVVDYFSSRYDAPDAIYELEKAKLRGNTLLVKALSAGMVKVLATIEDTLYEVHYFTWQQPNTFGSACQLRFC